MPVPRARLRYLEEEDAWPELGTHKIAVLDLLVTNPQMGYRPTELMVETGVPKAELDTILEEFQADGYVETIGEYYLVNQDRLDEIHDILWTARQREATAPLRPPDGGSPTDTDSDPEGETPPEIDLSQPAPAPSDVFSSED